MYVRVFVGLVAGANAPQLISFASPTSATLFITTLIILAATRCSHFLLGILMGLVLTGAELARVLDDQVAATYVGDSLVLVCTIADFPVVRDSTSRFDARCAGSVRLPRRIRLSWRDPPAHLYPGDRWQLEARLRRPGGLRNPGGFDAEKAAAAAGIGAIGYVVDGNRNRLLASDGAPLDGIRLQIARRILERLPHRDSAAIIVALAIGSRHAMNDAQWQRYAASGTTHLVAISGLHIGLVAALGTLLGRLLAGLLRLRVNQRRGAMLFGAVSAVVYTALSGFGIPAQRACLMLLILVSAWLSDRESDGIQLLSIAGILVFLLDPLAALSAGFNLSFLAVATLIWVARSRRVTQRYSGLALVHHRLGQLGFVQIALFAALLSIAGAHFGRISLSAPLLNLVAVPLFSLVTVPMTLFSVVMTGLDSITLPLAALSVEWLDAMTHRAAVTAAVPVSKPAVLVAGIGVCAWVLLPKGFPGRLLAPACLLPLLLPAASRVEAGCLKAVFFDVGQGTAILIETSAHRLLYDTGPAYRSGRSAADTAILPYFQAAGIDSLDRLVVSHSDLDHAGGLLSLTSEVRVGRILSGEPIAGNGWTHCHSHQEWIWDGVRFEFLLPDRNSRESGNDASCVLRISAGDQSALLTGDIEQTAERKLLAGEPEAVSLLSVPHHGSRTSSTLPLVRALAPAYAVVSAGYQNRWGLPDPAVVERWVGQGSIVLNTATEGAIEFEICPGEAPRLLHRQRRDKQMRWHRSLPVDQAPGTENF